jgi:hypothetical protein
MDTTGPAVSSRQRRPSTLSRAQDLAFRLSQTENVAVSGGFGSGKTFLANAIALYTVQTGASCLLVGPDRYLDTPASFQTPGGCNSILLERAMHASIIPTTILPDPIEARARVTPRRLRSAKAILNRAKKLLEAHALTPAEIEQSVAFGRPLSAEAADLVTVICNDGERIADALWSGNERAGRSLRDVLDVVSNARSEIPPDGAAAALILADDEEFEEQLASLSARADRPVEERELAAAIASLVNPPPSDKTLIDVYRHLGWMSRGLREAIELAQRHESLDAAIAKHQNAPGARIIQVFVRNRPEQLASDAISTFEAARLRYDEDAARLEPYLRRHGLRTLKSVSSQNASESTTFIPPAKFAQKIRQSRHATRRLPDLLASLRAILPQPLVDEITAGPIEEAHVRLREFRASDPRSLAAMELRELRSLFAETGFGDVLSPPTLPESSSPIALVRAAPPPYSAEFLDLLLEIDAESDCSHVYESSLWPESLERARTGEELASLPMSGKRFDVVVTDDADRFDLDLLERLASSRVHRLGVAASSSNISLGEGFRTGESISVQLEPADAVGLVYVEAPELEAGGLAAVAARLAEHLQHLGFDAVVAPHEGAPALLIASADIAEEKQARRLLDFADGVVVLCRSWRVDPDDVVLLSADARAALQLGWRVRKTFADGLLLEKDGRVAALVNEPQGELATDEVIVDLTRRMETRGWSPIVCWRDAPRDPAELARLIQGRSTALDKNAAVAKVVRQFVLSPSSPVPGPPPNDKSGSTERAEADSTELVADPLVPTAIVDDSADRIGERGSEVGDTQQIDGSSAEDPALVAIHEAEAPGLSGNGHLHVPWSANSTEEGAETVAHVDNTVSATETTAAPHREEATAVEQPALSEASQALEGLSELAPAAAVGSETIAPADHTTSAPEITNAPHRVEAAAVEQPALSEASQALEVPSEPAPAPVLGSETVAQADNTASATETTNAPHGAAVAVAVEQPMVSEASSDFEVPLKPAPAPAVGSETIAQADNTASATEMTNAPQGAEAAAVEQPALSEAFPALEVPSEPAPAPAVGSETVAQIVHTVSATETADTPHRVEAAAVEQAALSEVRSGPPAAPAMAVDEESQAAIEREWSPLLEKGLIPRNPAGSNGPNSFG